MPLKVVNSTCHLLGVEKMALLGSQCNLIWKPIWLHPDGFCYPLTLVSPRPNPPEPIPVLHVGWCWPGWGTGWPSVIWGYPWQSLCVTEHPVIIVQYIRECKLLEWRYGPVQYWPHRPEIISPASFIIDTYALEILVHI